MSTTTSIEWTATVNPDGSVTPGASWNPIRGCERISPGCTRCYAERIAARFSGPGKPLEGLVKITNGRPAWTGVVREAPEQTLLEPLHWKRPRKVFVNSMSDLFHEDVPNDTIDRVFAVMALCPQHTFLILTKRADRMRKYFEDLPFRSELIGISAEYISGLDRYMRGAEVEQITGCGDDILPRWPLPFEHVCIGVSAENQEYADKRIPDLLATPAAVRLVSYEPALGPVDFRKWTDEGLECACGWRGIESDCKEGGTVDDTAYLCPQCGELCAHLPLDERLDWIICGGESGPGARPFNIEWARSVVRQCASAGVACFVKQMGSLPVGVHGLNDRKGGDPDEWPEDLRVRQFPEVRR